MLYICDVYKWLNLSCAYCALSSFNVTGKYLFLYTTSVTRKFVHPASSGYFLSFWEANKNPHFKQKGSWGYWLEFLLNEVACRSMSSSLKIDFREEGKILFLKKVQEVRKHAENVCLEAFTLTRWFFRKLPMHRRGSQVRRICALLALFWKK